MPPEANWYLKKHDDGSIHGPVDIGHLRDWSLAAKISPLDRVSNDGKTTWRRAPMVAALHMDWLVEVAGDFLYGPTTFGTIQEFLVAGEIDVDTTIINTLDGSRTLIKDMPAFSIPSETATASPGTITSKLDETDVGDDAALMSERLVKVERMLVQQRRALEEAELRYQRLRAKYIEKTGETP